MKDHVIDLNDCSEFRQTILASPPRLVHGWVWILIGLVTTAVLWSYATTADQVVKAQGRMRSAGNPNPSHTDLSGTRLSASTKGKIEEVFGGFYIAAVDVYCVAHRLERIKTDT